MTETEQDITSRLSSTYEEINNVICEAAAGKAHERSAGNVAREQLWAGRHAAAIACRTILERNMDLTREHEPCLPLEENSSESWSKQLA